MTIEHAELMRGPTGRVAQMIDEAVQAEIGKWVDLATESPMITPDARLALCELGGDLADYMPHAICTALTALQLTGAITINGEAP